MPYANFLCPKCNGVTRFSCMVRNKKVVIPKKNTSRTSALKKIICSKCRSSFKRQKIVSFIDGSCTIKDD